MTDTKRAGKQRKKKTAAARFVRGIIGSDTILHDPRPAIAFVGRSNVGKSSTLNMLMGIALARTSATPGKTQEINLYLVHDRMYFVDLPGYGYAKISAAAAEKIRKHILWYLSGGEASIALLILILDGRVGATEYDHELVRLACERHIPLLILVNKIDKLNQKERAETMNALTRAFPDMTMIPFSAKTGEGKDSVLRIIKGIVATQTKKRSAWAERS